VIPLRRLLVCLPVLAWVFVPAAGAEVILGVHGDAARFKAQTGQVSQINQVFIGFNQSGSLDRPLAQFGPIPLLALVTGSEGAHEDYSPQQIALGQADRFLDSVNRAIADWTGPRFYLRPLPEMNGHWNAYSAYNTDGSGRNSAHSTVWFRKAFERIVILARGGTRTRLSAELVSLGLPAVSSDLPVNSSSKLQVVWNPQGYGSPDLPGNSAQAYYPGDRYVDIVGDDLYDMPGHGATWAAAAALYDAHPTKRFAFAEWGLWGIDDPGFISAMAQFVKSHARTEFISYYSGAPGSRFDLASKPRSLAAYRNSIAILGR
jgi:hypothetical protein